MRSGMEKRILKKITAITFILILFMQIVMPIRQLFVYALVRGEDPMQRTTIQANYSDTNITLQVGLRTKYEDERLECIWQENNGTGWKDIPGSSEKYGPITMANKKDYQYRVITKAYVPVYYDLIYRAYQIFLIRDPEKEGYKTWESKIRRHGKYDYNNDIDCGLHGHMNHICYTQGATECPNEAAASALMIVTSKEYREIRKHETLETFMRKCYQYLTGVNYYDSSWISVYHEGGSTLEAKDLSFVNWLSQSTACINFMSNKYGYSVATGQLSDIIFSEEGIYYESTSEPFRIPTRTITLNKGTGISSVEVVGGDYNPTPGTSVTIKATAATGYTVAGWDDVTDRGTYTFTMPNNDITLTANATPISYTVAYNGNGNTGGSTPSTTHIYNRTKNIASNGYTRSYTITYNGNGGTTPSQQISNYTFYRWAQYANGTGNTYTNGQTNVGNLSSTNGATVTLYAQWTPVAVNLPSTSRNAYTFGGWYNGTSRIGGIGDSYIPTTNTTLNAHWELIKTNVAGNIEWNDRK